MRKSIALALMGALSAALLTAPSSQAESCAAPGKDWVKSENSKAGDRSWNSGVPFRLSADFSRRKNIDRVEGYFDTTSLQCGQSAALTLVGAKSAHVEIYRMGYYNGAGARKVGSVTIKSGWSFTASPSYLPGQYLFKLIAESATSILAETMEILGAEHLLAKRAITKEVGQQIIDVVARYEASINYAGIDIRGAQPSRGNIEGGLSTLEEKSLGAAKKAGNAQFTGVLEYAIAPTKPGLYFMDTPGHDIEQLAGFGAGHINVVVFTSGRGTPTGSAIMPTIKVSTNTPMYSSIPDLIDLDAGTIADGIETLAQVGDRIFDEIVQVANGQLTKAERGGHHEFALSRMYKTVVK